MSPLLIALLGVLLIPLFVATWRTSLLGLSCQGLLIAWIAFRLEKPEMTLGTALTVLDLVVVRALAAPLALYLVRSAQNPPRRNDVIPPNMLSWSLVLGLVLLAFRLAAVVVPQDGDQQTLVAVSSSGLLLGLMVLSTQLNVFSQIVAVVRMENAIALFELGDQHHDVSPLVRVGQIAVLIISVLLYRWYLSTLNVEGSPSAPPSPEAPAL